MNKSYRQISEELWGLLDSIDTLPDMLHPNTLAGHKKTWKMMVKRAEKRHLLMKTDGYGNFTKRDDVGEKVIG